MNHLSETVLENYLLGGDDDPAIEEHLLACDDCAAHVRAQIELELQLGEVARAATFCPGCNRVLAGDRCDACGATLTAGGYRIERVLVRTTHGRLYAAIDGNGNRVALKELAFVQAPTLESLAAFDRETKFLRALSHPCIPRFHASFIEGTGIHTRMYIAQDLVEGESLLARLQTHWFTDAEIVEIARRVLDILIYLQSLSPMVFHRDIKPANLVVRPDGSIALVDFGAARDVSETMGNTAVGTFGYMPLEQMAGVYDATTDLFALGASLLHLLTRREPWKLLDGSGVGLNISPGLRTYLDRLCKRDPGRRFSNARAARAALDELDNTPSKPRRTFPVTTVISTVAVIGVGLGAGVMMAMREEPAHVTVQAPRASRVEVAHPAHREPDPVRPAAGVEQPAARWRALFAVDELLGPGLVGRSPECSIMDRLPSGACPQSNPVPLPDHLEQRVAQLPTADATQLREQLAYAREQIAKYRTGGIAIGKIVRAGKAYYYAAAVAGSYEVAAHGYRRQVLPAVPDGEIRWAGDVNLEQVDGSDQVTITGNVQPGTVLTASMIHHFVAPSGAAATVWPTPPVSTTLDGDFKLAGFSPGDYRFTLTHDGTREEFDLSLPKGGELELGARSKRVRTDPSHVGDGYLVVSATPKAMLMVDGVALGLSTPTKVKLAAGKHKITFMYGTTKSSFPVRIIANETVTFHKELE